MRDSWLIRARRAACERLLPFALRLGSPTLAAMVASGMLRRKGTGKRLNVLAIAKDVFEQDLDALAAYGNQVQYHVLSINTLRSVLFACVGQDLDGVRGDNYHETEAGQAARQRYYDFLTSFLQVLNRLMKFDAVIGCNFGQVALQEFSRAVHNSELPYIIYFKEGIPIPERLDEYCALYEAGYMPKRIFADAVLVNSATGAEMISRMTINGLLPENIYAVGAPRLDSYRIKPSVKSERPSLVVFPFDPHVAFFYFKELWAQDERFQLRCNEVSGADSKLMDSLSENAIEIYRSIIAFARSRPDVDIVFKSKRNCRSKEFLNEAIVDVTGSPISDFSMDNVSWTDDWVAEDLIRKATAVISLNSMTTVEAILAGKPVFVPELSNVFQGKPWSFFHDFPNLVGHIESEADLIIYFDRVLRYEWQVEETEREAFLKRYTTVGGVNLSTNAFEDVLVSTVELNTRQGKTARLKHVAGTLREKEQV